MPPYSSVPPAPPGYQPVIVYVPMVIYMPAAAGPGGNPPPSQQLVVKLTDLATGETATAADNFFAP